MKNKLAELLEEASGLINNDMPTVEQMADYLIEHGVIVPKVNIGDKLYYISSVGIIVESKVSYVGAFSKGTCYTENGTPLLTSVFMDCEANRHYYFSREEAEKALAERSRK